MLIGRPPPIGREHVADHRYRARGQRRLAQADQQPRREKLAKARRKAPEERGGAPDRDPRDQQAAAGEPIRQQPEGYARHGIEDAEREPPATG